MNSKINFAFIMNLLALIIIGQRLISACCQTCQKENDLNIVDQDISTLSKFICQKDTKEVSVEKSLQLWIRYAGHTILQTCSLDNHHDPINVNSRRLDIKLPMLKGRLFFQDVALVIESSNGNQLFKGPMRNGHLLAYVNESLVHLPEWRTRLTFKLYPKRGKFSNNIMSIQGSLKNGKLHGLVQMYGILTRDPQDACAESIFEGLSFIGRYENGTPAGVCWRQLVGGSWLYGQVDKDGHFSGDNIAYIYQDLKLALIGRYKKGILVNGRQTEIIGQSCNKYGIKVLEFSPQIGPPFHFMKPSHSEFGDQPYLNEILDNKYIFLKKSDKFPIAGDGAFAKLNVTKDTVFCIYSGHLMNDEENLAHNKLIHETRIKKRLPRDHPEHLAQWKNKQSVNCPSGYRLTINVPPSEDSQQFEYLGSYGHKVNHSFQPNAVFINFDSPRYGLVRALKTLMEVKQGNEFFAHYKYSIDSLGQPKWYRDLYRSELQNHTSSIEIPMSREEGLRILQTVEEKIKYLDDKEL